jgi:hypothetical protein
MYKWRRVMRQPWFPDMEKVIPLSVVINDLEMYGIEQQLERQREQR